MLLDLRNGVLSYKRERACCRASAGTWVEFRHAFVAHVTEVFDAVGLV